MVNKSKHLCHIFSLCHSGVRILRDCHKLSWPQCDTDTIENTKKNEIFFGILLDLHYLCNMTTKNLYTTIGLLTCKTLVFIQNYPPQFCNRLKTRQTPLVLANPSLLLLAPAFSGRDFCVNHLIAESKNFLTPLLIWPNYQNQSI